MVMIPVGNNTKHNFGLWCLAEIYIRMIITAIVLINGQEILSVNQLVDIENKLDAKGGKDE